MDEHAGELRRTPLHDLHESLGGRMVPFAGWRMPVQYSSILDEARAVRSGAGLFDVSHMGRFEVRGPDAVKLLNRVLSPNIPDLRIRRARYGVICNREGGIIDDAIVYRLGAERYMLVPNASNAGTVYDWIERWRRESDSVEIEIATPRLAMIALQGPAAQLTLSALTAHDLPSLRVFRIVEAEIAGAPSLIARTGYTGEDGFELMVPAADAVRIWETLAAGGAVPCGLGARDVLRLEAGLPLHGNDIDAATNPFEAGLDRFVDLGARRVRGEGCAAPHPRGGAFAQARRLLHGRPGNRPPGLRDHIGRSAHRAGHQRELLADARPGHRDGLRPGGLLRSRRRNLRRHPGPSRRGRGDAAPLLRRAPSAHTSPHRLTLPVAS